MRGLASHDMKYTYGKTQHAPSDMTVTYATVKLLTRRINGHGHTLIIDSFFPSPNSYNTLTK